MSLSILSQHQNQVFVKRFQTYMVILKYLDRQCALFCLKAGGLAKNVFDTNRRYFLKLMHNQSFYFWSKGVTRSKFIQLYLTIYITMLRLSCVFGIRQQLPIKFCKKTPSGTSVAQNSLFSQIDVKRAKYKNLLI